MLCYCVVLIPLLIGILLKFFLGQTYLLYISEYNNKYLNNYCYGDDLCEHFQSGQIYLKFNSITALTYNLLSVKNVYFGAYNNTDVVLKKLAHSKDLNKLNDVDDNREILDILIKENQVCEEQSAKSFLHAFQHRDSKYFKSIVRINIEPLLFETFVNSKYVPKVYGFCGRMVVVENCGVPLHNLMESPWHERAFIAYQLIDLAEAFTFDDKHFKLYLTDISSDNIVVNTTSLKISVVDLGNTILQKRVVDENKDVHYSEHFPDEEYAFSKNQVCNHKISDHNVYAVCRLILSKHAIYPLQNGLLHSPPYELQNHRLFDLIEFCVFDPNHKSRFEIIKEIKQYLLSVLHARN